MSSGDPGASFAPGMVIADRFELKSPLGRGTMGSVWVAHHMTLDIDVALKFIDPELADRADLRSRFAQEAMAAAKIQSPHVVSVLDFGETEGKQPYIAMELLRGESLAGRLAREVSLPMSDVVRVMVHACKGLARAHAHGIVHRDLKPENLFLTEDEDDFLLKILDFGIAKAESQASVLHRTITGQLVGTPLYMSPEQSVSRPATFQSDLYSLASVAYHCITGRPVFDVENIAVLLVHLATKDPKRLRELVPDAPESLEVWFERALHKEPEQRFGSARDLAESFVRACQGGPSPVKVALDVSPHDEIAPRAKDSWTELTPPPPPRESHPGEPSAAAGGGKSPAGDTLVNAGGAAVDVGDGTPNQEPRVRVVHAGGQDHQQALAYAPTIRDVGGNLRDVVDRALEHARVDSQSDKDSKPADAARRVSSSGPPVASKWSLLIWVIAAVVAIGAAVAVGWFIGRTL